MPKAKTEKEIQGYVLETMDRHDVWEQKAFRERWRVTFEPEDLTNLDNEVIVASSSEEAEMELEGRHPAPDQCSFLEKKESLLYLGGWQASRTIVTAFYVGRYPIFQSKGIDDPEQGKMLLMNAVRQSKSKEILVCGGESDKEIGWFGGSRDYALPIGEIFVYRAPTTKSDYGRILIDQRLNKSLRTRDHNDKIKAEEANRKREKQLKLEAEAKARQEFDRKIYVEVEKSFRMLTIFMQDIFHNELPNTRQLVSFKHRRIGRGDLGRDLLLLRDMLYSVCGKKVFRKHYRYQSRLNSKRYSSSDHRIGFGGSLWYYSWTDIYDAMGYLAATSALKDPAGMHRRLGCVSGELTPGRVDAFKEIRRWLRVEYRWIQRCRKQKKRVA